MAYERLHWVESETPLSADNMNNIEDGIEELQSQKVDKVSGKALSDNNYTSDDKAKLAGIEEGAEVNPGNATTSAAGLMSAADKTKLNGIAAGAQVNRTYTAVTGKPTAAASPAFGGTVTVSQVVQSSTGQVSVTDRVITIPSSDATTSAHGLMSAADKTKLNGIETGANNYSLTKTIYTKKSSSNYVVSAGGRGSISFSLSGADKGSLTSVLLKDTEGNRVNLCIIGWEATSSNVTIFVYNPTSQSIQVDGTKSQIVVTTYN